MKRERGLNVHLNLSGMLYAVSIMVLLAFKNIDKTNLTSRSPYRGIKNPSDAEGGWISTLAKNVVTILNNEASASAFPGQILPKNEFDAMNTPDVPYRLPKPKAQELGSVVGDWVSRNLSGMNC